MIETIAQLARYLRLDVKALSVVSQNIANTSTVGYRSQRLLPDFAGSIGVTGVRAQLNSGPLIETGKALDLALEGDGYFAVADAQGLLLTRAGQFRRNAEGQLIDAANRVVLGESGAIALGPEPVTVNEQGDVLQGGSKVDRLLILAPSEGSTLIAETAGLRPSADAVAAHARVRSGALEGANVDSAAETIALIEISRHVESIQRALSIYDKTLETGINKIGESS